jgi:nitrous oxidase accessory protein NosD
LTQTDPQNASKSGGVTVVMISPGKVQLLSPRYSGNGCVERTLTFANGAPGLQLVENAGNMILTKKPNSLVITPVRRDWSF